MARWQLKEKHYINVEGTEWEYKETTDQGKQVRRVFNVPMYLDPESSADWTEPGMIVVCDGTNPKGRDLIFSGPPTPDMLPLDEEAETISASLRASWIAPIETVAMIEPVPVADDGFKDMMMKMMSQNAELIALLAHPASSERRI